MEEEARDDEEVDLLGGQHALSVEEKAREDEALTRPRAIFSFIVFYSAFISSVQYCIVLPTSLAYAEQVGGGATLAGLLVGAADICSIPVTLLLPKLTERLGFGFVFLLQAGLGIGGNVLYGLAGLLHSPVCLLVGRIIAGIVAAYSFTCPSFIGHFVPERDRTAYMQGLYISVYSGVALGPIIGAALTKVGDHGVALNANNSPGYFMALAYAIYVLILLLSPQFPSMPAVGQQSLNLRGMADWSTRKKLAVGLCVYGSALPAFLDGAWETATVLIASRTWSWSETHTGLVLGVILGSILLSNVAVVFLSYRFQDRKIIAVALVVLVFATSLFFEFDYGGQDYLKYVIAGLMYMPSVSIISSCFTSISTKIVAKQELLVMQALNGVALQLALFTAALFGTAGLNALGRTSFFLIILGLSFSLSVWTLASFRDLRLE